MAQQGRMDAFLSELEDTLREDRAQGKPVKSLWGFVEVARRASAKATTGESKVLKGAHGMYMIAQPDGSIRADSWNPHGDWEKFLLIPTTGQKVAIKTAHGKYITAKLDGTLLADSSDLHGDAQQFEVIEEPGDLVLIRSHHSKYMIAMPDGSVNANSDKPMGDKPWERFEMTNLARDFICDREKLFAYLDQLSADESHFKSLTYVVNQWALGGIVNLKHHGCILTEASGERYLKFDFGRWGVGWTLSETYPQHPKGTCLVETHEIKGDPQKLKKYLTGVQPFSWTANNCSTFSQGIIRELCSDDSSSGFDPWPTWSHVVANPPVRVPSILPSCSCPPRTDSTDFSVNPERMAPVAEAGSKETDAAKADASRGAEAAKEVDAGYSGILRRFPSVDGVVSVGTPTESGAPSKRHGDDPAGEGAPMDPSDTRRRCSRLPSVDGVVLERSNPRPDDIASSEACDEDVDMVMNV